MAGKKYIFIIAIVIVFAGVRLFDLPEYVNFGSDAGRDFLKIREIYQTKELTLIGPPSQYAINGREFFFGPAPYYAALPALLIGNWDVLAVSYWLIALNVAAVGFALFMLDRYSKDKRIVYVFGIISVFTPALIAASQSYWNPNFMLPVSFVLLALLLQSKHSRSMVFYCLIGFLFGLGMQFHYSFILAVIIGFAWLAIQHKLHPKLVLCIVAGGIGGFLPVILFELRNNFYNLNTFLLVLTNGSKALQGSTFNLFYLISVLPFAIYFVSLGIRKIKKNEIVFALSGFYILFCLVVWLYSPKPVLSYPALTALASAIKQDNPSDFNIVDQLTRDNRAMALRYVVTAQGLQPKGVEEYAQSKVLYIYSDQPVGALIQNPIWEIQSFVPYRQFTSKQVRATIWLYTLEK